MDLSSTNLSSQRLFLKCFSPEDALEVFEAVTPTVTRFMGFEPSPSLEAFEQIWQTWFPMMRLGTDGHFVIRTKSNLEFLGVATSSDQEISFLALCRQVAGGTASAREKSTGLATLPD